MASTDQGSPRRRVQRGWWALAGLLLAAILLLLVASFIRPIDLRVGDHGVLLGRIPAGDLDRYDPQGPVAIVYLHDWMGRAPRDLYLISVW